MAWLRCGVGLLVLLTGGNGRSPEPDGRAERSVFRLPAFDERGGVVVPVTIDGSGPFRFMLDTGSSRSAVADDLASELAARLVARTEVVSSAGPEMHDVARLERVELAGARATFLLASVIPAARLRTIGSEIRGVLAQDFLSEFNYTLDYRRGRLTWDGTAVASCDNRAAVPLVASEGRYLVKVSDGRSQSLRLVPDSGADSLVLFASRRTDDAPTAPGTVSVTGVTGSARARKVRAPRFVVGDVTLPNSPAVIVERDYAESDGLLPLHFFASVSFNMQDGCMIVRAR